MTDSMRPNTDDRRPLVDETQRPGDVTSTDEQDLTDGELESQDATELPDREAMSLVDLNLAAPVNAAVAANVLSDGSVAYADADQTAIIDQATNNDNDITP
ncbi:MAG TPA: hypothetical protein VH723_07785 [Candidatus Limnocylindrales bacterium]|jgi:hypothetical protein